MFCTASDNSISELCRDEGPTTAEKLFFCAHCLDIFFFSPLGKRKQACEQYKYMRSIRYANNCEITAEYKEM